MENNIVLDDKIKCQNCNYTIALRNHDDNTLYIPSDIEVMAQEKDKDTIIMTLQCKKCGCLVQVIS